MFAHQFMTEDKILVFIYFLVGVLNAFHVIFSIALYWPKISEYLFLFSQAPILDCYNCYWKLHLYLREMLIILVL